MIDKDLEENAKKEGYFHLKWLEFKHKLVLCGLHKLMNATGLAIDITKIGYAGRYDFLSFDEAVKVIDTIDKIPRRIQDLTGHWEKYLGIGGEIYKEK